MMKYKAWRESAIRYLKIHNEATTEELITKVKNQSGKLMGSRRMPTSKRGAANCLASDKRFVNIRNIKIEAIPLAVWGLKCDISPMWGEESPSLSIPHGSLTTCT